MKFIRKIVSVCVKKNREEKKKNTSTDIHQTSLNGGSGDLKTKNQSFGFVRLAVYCATDGVNWLNIESGSTAPVIKLCISAKYFRLSSLVSVCLGPKVW